MNILPSLFQALTQSFRTDIGANRLHLQVGEIVRATLLEMMDDHTALLQVKGQTLRAQFTGEAPAGSEIPLVVMGPTLEGVLELKVLQPATNPQPDSKLNSFPVDQLIRNLGVQDSPLTRQLVANLLLAQISVTKPLVQSVQSLLETEASMETIMFMIQKGIPLRTDTLQTLQTLWQGPSLQELFTSSQPANAPSIPEGMALDRFETFSLNLEELNQLPRQQKGKLMQTLVNRLGLAHEADVGQQIRFGNEPLSVDTATLKSLLLKATHEQADNPILQHVTAQQLMHSGKEPSNLFFYQFFSLPVVVEQQPADAKVHLLTRKKGEQLDPFNCYLYFQLTMPHLGEVGVHLQVVERMVSIRLLRTNGPELAPVQTEIAVLREGLKAAGYHLANIRSEIASVHVLDPFTDLPVRVTDGRFDLKV